MDITILPEGCFIKDEKIDDLRQYLSNVPNYEYIKVTLYASIECDVGFVQHALQTVTDLNYKDVRLATIESSAT